MYQFIIKRTEEMEGQLQVIIVDHAEPNENKEFYKKYICENWWPIGKNLVPSDWYEEAPQQKLK